MSANTAVDKIVGMFSLRKAAAVVAVIFALTLLNWASTDVPQGHVGLLVSNMTGKIDRTLDPGWRLAMPVGQRLVIFPTLQQQYVMVAASGEGQNKGDDSVQVNSAEGQAFNVDASVDYRLANKEAAGPLYQKYGMDFERIVETRYRSKFSSVIINAFASLPLAQAITGPGRVGVEHVAAKELQEDLASDGIAVTRVMIRAVHVPDAIANSIAAKTKAENDLVQSRTNAQQKVVEARAGADAEIASAEGSAKATMIRANAEAAANHKIANSLTGPILRKLAIEKLNPNVQLVLPDKAFYNFTNVPAPVAAAQ